MISSGPREAGDSAFRLREVVPADSGNLYRWRMDPASISMFRSNRGFSRDEHDRFITGYFEASNRDRWFIVESAGVPVGTISLYALSPDGRQAEWGRLVIAPEERRKGHARKALLLVIDHAQRIGVERLTCGVVAGNLPAERLYESTGFREIGRETVAGREYRTLRKELSPRA